MCNWLLPTHRSSSPEFGVPSSDVVASVIASAAHAWWQNAGHLACRSELLRGPLYYVLVLMAATVVYWRESPVGVVAMSLMCGGDGLADVVGRRLGQGNRLPWNPAKSWAGSAAMLLGEALPWS